MLSVLIFFLLGSSQDHQIPRPSGSTFSIRLKRMEYVFFLSRVFIIVNSLGGLQKQATSLCLLCQVDVIDIHRVPGPPVVSIPASAAVPATAPAAVSILVVFLSGDRAEVSIAGLLDQGSTESAQQLLHSALGHHLGGWSFYGLVDKSLLDSLDLPALMWPLTCMEKAMFASTLPGRPQIVAVQQKQQQQCQRKRRRTDDEDGRTAASLLLHLATDAVATDAVATDAVATDAVATDAVATDAAATDAAATAGDVPASNWADCPFGWHKLKKETFRFLLQQLFHGGGGGSNATAHQRSRVVALACDTTFRELFGSGRGKQLGFLKFLYDHKFLLHEDLPVWALSCTGIRQAYVTRKKIKSCSITSVVAARMGF